MIKDHLLIYGVIYSSVNYHRQTSSCDYILTFTKDGVKTVGYVEKFVSVCNSCCVCSLPCQHTIVAKLPPLLNMEVSIDSAHQQHKHHHLVCF